MNLFARAVRMGSECFVEYLPDGEAVLLHRGSEQYFGLDEMGVQVFLAVTSHPSVEDAYQELLTAYEVEPDELRRDIERLITDLVSHELLEFSSD
jgi:hypothetical protein